MRLGVSKKLLGYIGVGLLAYVVFLIAAAPASLLTRYVVPQTPVSQRLDLTSPRGSMWNGEFASARYAHLDLGRVQWQINAMSLLLGRLNMDLRFNGEGNKGHGNLALGMSRQVEAQDLYLSLPAEQVIPFIPLLQRFRINADGEVQANFKEVSVKQGERLNAGGRVVWRDASLLVPYNMDLGHFVANLTPQGEGSRIEVEDQGDTGPVMLNATITVNGDGAFDMTARLKARDAAQQHITSALRALGRPDGKGWVSIRQKGAIPNWRVK